MKQYKFHFMVNWFGHIFNGVDLGFNCSVTIGPVIQGNSDTSQRELDPNIEGQGSNIITLAFGLDSIGADGITVYVTCESDVLPQVTAVTLYQPNQAGKIPYTSYQIQQINDKLWPK